ncbi:hypothetical protein JCM10207_001788 [Rhodosporidiobolus poonsookiae]
MASLTPVASSFYKDKIGGKAAGGRGYASVYKTTPTGSAPIAPSGGFSSVGCYKMSDAALDDVSKVDQFYVFNGEGFQDCATRVQAAGNKFVGIARYNSNTGYHYWCAASPKPAYLAALTFAAAGNCDDSLFLAGEASGVLSLAR